MIFLSFEMISNTDGIIIATARGHATDVIRNFRDACALLFIEQGAWRITEVVGVCLPEVPFDSDMAWTLRAERKVNR